VLRLLLVPFAYVTLSEQSKEEAMRKFLILFLAGLLFAAAACEHNEETAPPAPGAAASPMAPAPAEPAPPPAAAPPAAPAAPASPAASPS
jgi:hypothetical protein